MELLAIALVTLAPFETLIILNINFYQTKLRQYQNI